MAKSLIRNTLGPRTFGFAVPAGGTEAKAFADAALDGTYEILEVESSTGNETEAGYNDVTVTGKNSADNRKATFRFYAKSTMSEDDIRTALKGKTYNNVTFDEVYVINLRPVTL